MTAELRRTLRSHSAAEPQLTGEGKPVRRATGYEHQKLKPRYPAAVVFISLRDIAQHRRVDSPSFRSDSVHHEALIRAVFPRLFAYLGVTAVAAVLLRKRAWAWVERVRVVLLAGVWIRGVSVWLEVRYFPGSPRSNGARWIGLCLWLL